MTNKHETYSEDELVALLPFYLNDKIEPEEREAVDSWLSHEPKAAEILEKISEERHATALANEAIPLPRGGLERLMADVAVTKQEASLAGASASLSGLLGKIVAPLRAAPAELAWGVCGLLMLVTVSQSALLYNKEGGGPTSGPGIELAGGEMGAVLSTAIVKFADAAQIADIANALDEAGAIIVSGPTARGQFTIAFVERPDGVSLDDRYEALKSDARLLELFVLRDAK